MKFSHRLRMLAHRIYYFKSSQKRKNFALKCHDVTTGIDIHDHPKKILDRFRFWLHLSLCQACKNYYDLSNGLSKSLKLQSQKNNILKDTNIDRINADLLKKHSHKIKDN